MTEWDPDRDDPPATLEELDRATSTIDQWVDAEAASNPIIAAVERGEPGQRRWYVRVHGEQKDTFTIWLTLRQRMLHYETYVMPAPEENHADFYQHLLVRNMKLVGAAFAIGDEDAIFLKGALAINVVDPRQLDHVLGLLYATVEQCFRPALRIGFRSRFGG